MGKTVRILAYLALFAFIAFAGYWGGRYEAQHRGEIPVCHSKTEDSDIKDCDYRNGTWYTK